MNNEKEYNYDVAIIGAGPAGSTLAYFLSHAGIKTVLIDKESFPRKKVCAGGLPIKVLGILPFDISSVIEKEIYEVTLTHKLKGDYKRVCPKPLLYTVDREKFDDFLVQQAIKAGAIFLDGRKVETLDLEGNTWTVKLADSVISASVLVGGDGATSFVAKTLSLKPSDRFHMGLQYEVPVSLLRNANCLERGIVIDWGWSKDTYGWIFPKKTSAYIGVQGPFRDGKQLKIYLDSFLCSHGVSPKGLVLNGHLIPHRTSASAISTQRSLLVGDAAGLVDYWTGEGIFHAIKSSQIAAKQISRFIDGKIPLNEYEMAINKEIMPEIKTSYQFSKVFNYLSALAFKTIREHDYPWDIFCRIMRGDRTFLDIKKRFRPNIFLSKLLIKGCRGHLGKK
jgi:geranylgeranyl reductase family protein